MGFGVPRVSLHQCPNLPPTVTASHYDTLFHNYYFALPIYEGMFQNFEILKHNYKISHYFEIVSHSYDNCFYQSGFINGHKC